MSESRRRLPRALVALLAACGSIALATPAIAAPVLFTFTFSGADNGSFLAESHPAPTFTDANSFVAPISGSTGDFVGGGGAEFYLTSGGGGLALYVGPGSSTLLSAAGPQLFSGPLASPAFLQGTYLLHDPNTLAETSLTISGPGAPAPELGGGWLAALAAFAALVAARRGAIGLARSTRRGAAL